MKSFKKIMASLLVLVLVLSLVACGEPQSVIIVEDLINDIGVVTEKSGDVIIKAEKEYNYLTENEQQQVSNYNILQRAKDEYENAVKDYILGIWVDSNSAVGYEFLDNGQFHFYVILHPENPISGTWTVEDKYLKLTYPSHNYEVLTFLIDFDYNKIILTHDESLVYYKTRD